MTSQVWPEETNLTFPKLSPELEKKVFIKQKVYIRSHDTTSWNGYVERLRYVEK